MLQPTSTAHIGTVWKHFSLFFSHFSTWAWRSHGGEMGILVGLGTALCCVTNRRGNIWWGWWSGSTQSWWRMMACQLQQVEGRGGGRVHAKSKTAWSDMEKEKQTLFILKAVFPLLSVVSATVFCASPLKHPFSRSTLCLRTFQKASTESLLLSLHHSLPLPEKPQAVLLCGRLTFTFLPRGACGPHTTIRAACTRCVLLKLGLSASPSHCPPSSRREWVWQRRARSVVSLRLSWLLSKSSDVQFSDKNAWGAAPSGHQNSRNFDLATACPGSTL